MSEDARAVLEAALKLSPEDQILIAEEIYEAVDGEASEAEFAAELARRTQEAKSGIDKGIPWREVLGEPR